MDPRICKDTHGVLHVGAWMRWEDDFDVPPRTQLHQAAANVPHRPAMVLSPMRRYEHHAAARCPRKRAAVLCPVTTDERFGYQRRIHGGVPSNDDARGFDALAE